MNIFKNNYSEFLVEFGKGKKMVLSSSENDEVTSRMMSVVQMDGAFYFQTDKEFRKYRQLINNPRVALCIDNIQIEGICEKVGHPMDNTDFCKIYQECYSGSYKMYSALKSERLFKITPVYLERWIYKEGVPYMEIFDIEKQTYKLSRYEGM